MKGNKSPDEQSQPQTALGWQAWDGRGGAGVMGPSGEPAAVRPGGQPPQGGLEKRPGSTLGQQQPFSEEAASGEGQLKPGGWQ